MLLAVFFVAFFLRASVYGYPALDSRERSFFLDENGEPYLTENDSYYYLRKAREMAEQGSVAWTQDRNDDPLIGQRTYDREKGAVQPLGLSVLAYLLGRLLSLFGFSLTRTAAWMGPVFGSLAVTPAFLYVRRRTSLWGGVTAAFLAGCAIPFVIHTQAGFFDTDMVLAVLPLTAVPAQMLCLCERDRRRRAAFAFLGAAAFAVTALFWRAHYGYLLFSEAALLLSAGLMLFPFSFPELTFSQRLRQILPGLLAGLLLPLLLLFLVRGSDGISELLHAASAYRAATGSTDSMPYALEHVMEMQPLRFLPGGGLRRLLSPGTDSLLGRMGGLVPFSLALLYFPLKGLRLYRARRHRENGAEDAAPFLAEAVFFGLWLIIGSLLAVRAVRFAEIAVLPVCLLCGLAVGELFRFAGKASGRSRIAAAVLCAGLAAAAALPVFFSARNTLRQSGNGTLINDSKQDAMDYVRDHTPENTVIASWWDDGYYWEYQGERRTLADGGSDSGALSWFLAKALLTDDPQLMTGIFRMLSESGTDALDDLTALGMEQAEAADLLLRILPLSRSEAEDILREMQLPPDLLDRTHPADPDPLVLALSTDLLYRYTSLGYFAFWNPETRTQEESAFTLSSAASAVAENGETVLQMTNAAYTLRLREEVDGGISAEYTAHGETYPLSRLCVWENGERIRDERQENGRLAAVALRENGRYAAFLCSGNLCDSMLVHLLVCEDENVTGIKKLGTWYADTAADESTAQLRIGYGHRASWITQVWQLGETDEEGNQRTND